MKKVLLTTLTAGLAVLTCGIGTAQAQSVNLQDSRPDLFNTFNSMVNSERLAIDNSLAQLMEIDPQTLRWMTGVAPLEVYFINEGAAYRNMLSFSVNSGAQQTIFGDISSTESVLSEKDGALRLGDGQVLGTFAGNTQIDFFLTQAGRRADGSTWTGHTFGTQAAANPFGLQHFIAKSYFDAVTQESWLLLGVEDLVGEFDPTGKGSDRDFNDAVFAVRGLIGTPIPGPTVPEPATLLGLLGVAALGATRLRRNA
ncbi:DUF4114 domain-containing protein [Spirulina sp. CCNP1310]|uniref:DUF4114 domain-containing protein n=1 Tax=Spirulina sp. CCNP1310 TaxID=3110249 RepID=UPI002B1F21BF|nr:DUF4114 domain-containing protein [Spirulina sp. CCNP1310]MEA5417780.1 DUF4114 domain-containing protein [Spirulina sp. CCNP1310]